MSQHGVFQEMLARRAELNPAEEERLRDHLAVCPSCRARAAEYERQRELLRSLPLAQPPLALRANVLQRIREPRTRNRPYWRWPLLLAPLAAALVLALVLAGQLPHSPTRTAAPAPHGTSARPTQIEPYAGPKETPAPHHQVASPVTTISPAPSRPVRHTPSAAHPAPHPTPATLTNPQPGSIVSQRLPAATPTSPPARALAPPAPSPTSPFVAVAPVGAAGVAKGVQPAAPKASPVQHPVSAGHLVPATPLPSPTPLPPTAIPSSSAAPTGTPAPATPLPPTASPTAVVETPLPAPNRAVPAEAPPVLPAAPRKPFPPLPIFLPPTLVPIPTANPTP